MYCIVCPFSTDKHQSDARSIGASDRERRKEKEGEGTFSNADFIFMTKNFISNTNNKTM